MMGRHVADSPVDTDRLSPWVRSHLEAPSHAAGPHRDPFENRRAYAAERDERAAYAEATGYRLHEGKAWAGCVTTPAIRERERAEYVALGIDPALLDIIEEQARDGRPIARTAADLRAKGPTGAPAFRVNDGGEQAC